MITVNEYKLKWDERCSCTLILYYIQWLMTYSRTTEDSHCISQYTGTLDIVSVHISNVIKTHLSISHCVVRWFGRHHTRNRLHSSLVSSIWQAAWNMIRHSNILRLGANPWDITSLEPYRFSSCPFPPFPPFIWRSMRLALLSKM